MSDEKPMGQVIQIDGARIRDRRRCPEPFAQAFGRPC